MWHCSHQEIGETVIPIGNCHWCIGAFIGLIIVVSTIVRLFVKGSAHIWFMSKNSENKKIHFWNLQLLAKSRKPQYCLCSMRTIHKLYINQIKFHMVTSHSFVSLVQFERHWPDDVCSKNSGIPIQSLASNIIPFALISADVQFLSTQMRPILTETDAIILKSILHSCFQFLW